MKPAACALLVVLSQAATPAIAQCILYQHINYGGASWALDGNERMIMSVDPSVGPATYYEPSWNDQLSSLRVTGYCVMTVWEHVNQGGAWFQTDQSYNYIGDAWNDQVSEVFCSCPW